MPVTSSSAPAPPTDGNGHEPQPVNRISRAIAGVVTFADLDPVRQALDKKREAVAEGA